MQRLTLITGAVLSEQTQIDEGFDSNYRAAKVPGNNRGPLFILDKSETGMG